MAMRGHVLHMATGETSRSFSFTEARIPVGLTRRPFPLDKLAATSQVTPQGCVDSSPILAAGLEALDLLHVGVIVTSASRQLLFANQTAERILLENDGLGVTPEGMPFSRDKSSGLSLVVYQVVRNAESGSHESTTPLLAVRRSSGKRPLTLLVRSLLGNPGLASPSGPAVLLFMWDPELPVCDAEVRLRQLFALTPAEARLAKLLMEGQTLEECCGQLEIQISTARMHLGSVFAKTGVQRQGQLVSLLWKSVGMVSTGREENIRRFAQVS
jgi:DNA-binding CsgD family transcriptional regulator